MTIEITMPALSPTMEKGTLAKWLVREGDRVEPGDMVAEIETDKATMEIEAVDGGFVAAIVVAEGTDGVLVGTVIALLAEEMVKGESAPPDMAADLDQAGVAPVGKPLARDTTVVTAAPPVTSEPRGHDAGPIARTPPIDRVRISPLAARIAAADGIDLGGIAGTGPNGRIVRADLRLPKSTPAAPSALPGPLPVPAFAPPPEGVPVESVKLSNMRRTIARRLTESKQTVPHFYLTARCNLDALSQLRGRLNAGLAARGLKLSVNDLLIKAMGLALLRVPDANVQFGGDELHRFSRADISMAVAVEGGLITPVLRDVGSMSLTAIAEASRRLAAKAREGKLTLDEYQGGTASISNLGMFGIDEMFPVINSPQALILGIGAGIEQPWKVGDGIALATVMAATGSFDHRAIDGAVAAQFMAAFRDIVEDPLQIVA